MAIGVDVGGTKIAAGLVRLPSGQVIARRATSTPKKDRGMAVLAEIVRLVEELFIESQVEKINPLPIGIGVPELVDLQGNITSAYTIQWMDIPVRTILARFGPSVIESDVRAGALAEAHLGAGQDFQLFVYLSIGTGISHCLVQNGVPYRGARGNALLVGSGEVVITCPVCSSPTAQTLEEVASGPALVTLYNERVPPEQALENGQAVLAAAKARDKAAAEVVRMAGRALGNSTALLVNILDPEAVVVGGGLGLAGGSYWSSFEAHTRRYIWPPASRQIPILTARLGEDAGIIGAALFAGQSIFSELSPK